MDTSSVTPGKEAQLSRRETCKQRREGGREGGREREREREGRRGREREGSYSNLVGAHKESSCVSSSPSLARVPSWQTLAKNYDPLNDNPTGYCNMAMP